MYGKNGVESDGELYRMQQEAIQRARETAKSATLPPEPMRRDRYYMNEPEQISCRIPEKHQKHNDLFNFKGISNIFSGLFKNLTMEDILLLGVLILLLMDDADDEIILLVLFLFISGIF